MQVQRQYTIPNLTVGDGLLIYTTQTNYARDYQTFTLYQVDETDGTTATAHRITHADKEPETIQVHLNNPKITITHGNTCRSRRATAKSRRQPLLGNILHY